MKISKKFVKSRGFWIFLFFIGIFSFFVIQKVFVSEEKRIERMIGIAKRAFEKEDPELLFGFISKGYQDEMGFDYSGVREGLYEIFSQFEGIKVSLSELEVEVVGEEAEVQLDVWIFAKYEDQPVFLIGSLNNPVPSKVFLQREEGEWKVVKFLLSSSNLNK